MSATDPDSDKSDPVDIGWVHTWWCADDARDHPGRICRWPRMSPSDGLRASETAGPTPEVPDGGNVAHSGATETATAIVAETLAARFDGFVESDAVAVVAALSAAGLLAGVFPGDGEYLLTTDGTNRNLTGYEPDPERP